MKHLRKITVGAALVAIFVLIFDSKTAFGGASEGVRLCVETVIPSLFPFFVVSVILTSTVSARNVPFLTKLCKPLAIAQGAHTLMLVGFLGGYPIGAQCIAQACKSGRLDRRDGERMLAFCNNAGPAFLFGIGATLFPSVGLCWLVWGIHIVSALIVARITAKNAQPSVATVATQALPARNALEQAVRAMALVCGWIIVFRVGLAFAERWFLWMIPGNLQLLFVGLFELTNGCCALESISSVGLRMQLFSVMLGFGGVCVGLQTMSVVRVGGLRGRQYFPGKTAQAAISYLLSVAVQCVLPLPFRHFPPPYYPALAAAVVLWYAFSRKKTKNRSSIYRALPV